MIPRHVTLSHLDEMETQRNIVLSLESIQQKNFHLPNNKIATNHTTIIIIIICKFVGKNDM